jgi:RHS repeat-associated protein
MCGLGNTNSSVNYTDWSTYTGFEYAFYPAVGASLLIYKSGIQRGTLGTYAASDRLKVAVESGAVKYYKNGNLVYTSTVAPTYPLQVDTSFYTVGALISDVTISNAVTQGSVNYVLQDAQGSSRAITNNVSGSSTIVARHDYLPFGEGIPNNTGLRNSGQGYDATDKNRLKYALTERDSNGLDHTCWRKHENTAGRWTTPDPYAGSMRLGNPQSFNRYSYVQNDPVNLIDPVGLQEGGGTGGIWVTDPAPGLPFWIPPILAGRTINIGGTSGGGGGRGFGDPLPEEFGEILINPNLDIDTPFSREFDCNRNANHLFRTLRRNFSKFASYAGPFAGELATAFISFEKGPVTEGRVINISTGVLSNAAVPGTGAVPSQGRQISVTVQNVSTTSFTFKTNPGHILYPGSISFSATDIGNGRISASVVAKGNYADTPSWIFFDYMGGKQFESDVWNNFLDNLQRSCGSLMKVFKTTRGNTILARELDGLLSDAFAHWIVRIIVILNIAHLSLSFYQPYFRTFFGRAGLRWLMLSSLLLPIYCLIATIWLRHSVPSQRKALLIDWAFVAAWLLFLLAVMVYSFSKYAPGL